MISVILPILNDAGVLPDALNFLAPYADRADIILVDGGSEDGSWDLIRPCAWARGLETTAGRGHQMNVGAAAARGDILLFLHADTTLVAGWMEAVERAVARPGFALGAFRFTLNQSRCAYRILEWGVRMRNRWFRLPYGDQALFVKRADFYRVGGYRPIPIMEDVELVRRLRREGRVAFLNEPALSSARRWERDGVLARTVRNGLTLAAYRLGLSPARVQRFYHGPRQAILIFCKWPEPGRVKTRLAAAIGPQAAANVYRSMVRQTLQAAKACAKEATVLLCIDPPSRLPDVRHWLGHTIRCLPQAEGDLGRRMLAAFVAAAARGFHAAVVIGTDCPDLEPDHLRTALAALRRTDVVLGPSEDGGYYLIGMSHPHDALFRDIAWSTDRVLDQTQAAAVAAGLRTQLLPVLRDVDSVEDLKRFSQLAKLAPAVGPRS